MATQLNDNLAINSPKLADNRQGVFETGKFRPYKDTSEVFSLLPKDYRAIGLSLFIKDINDVNAIPVEYWFEKGVEDFNLVVKNKIDVDSNILVAGSNLGKSVSQSFFDKLDSIEQGAQVNPEFRTIAEQSIVGNNTNIPVKTINGQQIVGESGNIDVPSDSGGVATQTTPTAPDTAFAYNVSNTTSSPLIYSNFGGIEVPAESTGRFVYDFDAAEWVFLPNQISLDGILKDEDISVKIPSLVGGKVPDEQINKDSILEGTASENDLLKVSSEIDILTPAVKLSLDTISQEDMGDNFFIQFDGFLGGNSNYRVVYFPIETGKQYLLEGSVTSPAISGPTKQFGLYSQVKDVPLNSVNNIDGAVIIGDAGTEQGAFIHDLYTVITPLPTAQFIVVTQKKTEDSISVSEYIDTVNRLKSVESLSPVVSKHTDDIVVLDTILKSQAVPVEINIKTDGQYLNFVGTANLNSEYELQRFEVNPFDVLFISGQLTAPDDGSPQSNVGRYGLYTSTSMGSLISGTLALQAENTTQTYSAIVIAPENSKYLNVSIKKGIDSVDIRRVGDLSSLLSRFPELIALFGDSITWGSAPEDGITWATRLQNIIGDKIKILNCGVGGENLWQISARQGGVPMVNAQDFVLPALASETVQVGAYSNFIYDGFFKSSYNRTSNVALLGQGETGRNETFKTVNPVYVDGIECTLKFNIESTNPLNGTYTLQRNQNSASARTIYSGTPIITNAAKLLKPKAMVIWMGTNEGFTGGVVDVLTLIDIYKRMVTYGGVNKYVIIGIYGGTGISGMSVDQLEAMELDMQKAFGVHYFNIRKYVVTNALEDAGITATTADTTAISQGKCPPSLLADGLHPNTAFSVLIAQKVFDSLNYQGVV